MISLFQLVHTTINPCSNEAESQMVYWLPSHLKDKFITESKIRKPAANICSKDQSIMESLYLLPPSSWISLGFALSLLHISFSFVPLSHTFYSPVSENFFSLDFVAFNHFCRTGGKFRLSISTTWKIQFTCKWKIKFLAILTLSSSTTIFHRLTNDKFLSLNSSFAKGQYIVYT